MPQLLSEFKEDRMGWSGQQQQVAWESTGPCEFCPLHRPCGSTSQGFCVCALNPHHLLLPPMFSASSLFSVLRASVDSYPRPMAPFLLFVICCCVLQALPQYFWLLPPPFWVNVESRAGWTSGIGAALATEVWSWA